MRCDRFEQRLNELLDQRENPLHNQRLAQHAERCAACRGLLETQRLVLSILQRQRLEREASSRATPSPCKRPQPRQPVPSLPRKTGGEWLALATAACVAALLLGNWITPPGPHQDRRKVSTVASVPPRQDRYSLPATDTASRSPLVHPSLQPSAATPGGTSPPWANWRELDFRWLLPDTEDVPRLTKAQLLDRVKRVGGTIRPLTSSVSSTLNILKRTWPGTQTPAKASADQAVIPAESDLLV